MKKKVLFIKKNYLGRSQYQNKKALFTDSTFWKVLGPSYHSFLSQDTKKCKRTSNFPPVDTRKQKQDGFVRYFSRKEEKKGKGKLSCSNTN